MTLKPVSIKDLVSNVKIFFISNDVEYKTKRFFFFLSIKILLVAIVLGIAIYAAFQVADYNTRQIQSFLKTPSATPQK